MKKNPMRWTLLGAAALAAAVLVLGPGRGRLISAQTSPAARAIAPGKDLSPHFSDPYRAGLILKIVSDVYHGNPLPFPKDGVVFENRQKLLPIQPKGYYREYTVLPKRGSPTVVSVGEQTFNIPSAPPGNRGAERLIIGGGEVLYYTPDHYKTFLSLQVLR